MDLPKGIRRRGDRFEVTGGSGKRRRTRVCSTLDEALALRRSFEAEASPRVELFTIGRALRAANQNGWNGTRWGETAVKYAHEFADAVGGLSTLLDRVSIDQIEEWVEALEARGISDSTINRRLAVVSRLYSLADEHGGVTRKPRLPKRKTRQGRIRVLSVAEEQAVISYMEKVGKPECADCVVILVDTGMRVGELFNLKPDDLTPQGAIIWESKGGRPRTVPLTQRARRALQQRIGWLGERQHRRTLENAWEAARAHLKLTNDSQFVPHALRHTFASRLVQRGNSLIVVRDLMGHASIQTTAIYAHFMPSHLNEAISSLEREQVERY